MIPGYMHGYNHTKVLEKKLNPVINKKFFILKDVEVKSLKCLFNKAVISEDSTLSTNYSGRNIVIEQIDYLKCIRTKACYPFNISVKELIIYLFGIGGINYKSWDSFRSKYGISGDTTIAKTLP